MCHIFCDTASAKKPPTPKTEKGKRYRKANVQIVRDRFQPRMARRPQSDPADQTWSAFTQQNS